jgi:hypothetical protein
LCELQLTVACSAGDLTIAIHNTVGGVPGNTVLAQVVIPGGDIPPYGLCSALRSGILTQVETRTLSPLPTIPTYGCVSATSRIARMIFPSRLSSIWKPYRRLTKLGGKSRTVTGDMKRPAVKAGFCRDHFCESGGGRLLVATEPPLS